MDFEQLRIFLILAEERTFLGTANRLATSRSRVRRKLDQLEQAAGTPLVARDSQHPGSKRGLVLTAAGEALAQQGRSLLDDAEQLVSNVREIGNDPMGILRIAMPIAPPPIGWGDTCQRALSLFPKLRIEVIHHACPSSLLPTQAELAITFENRLPDRCRVIELGEFGMQLVASDAYLEEHGTPGSVSALRDHRIAAWQPPEEMGDRIPLRSGEWIEIDPVLRSQEPLGLYQHVLSGECMGYLPALPQLVDPAVKTLFGELISGRLRQALVIPERLAEIPRVGRFVEICRPSGISASA